MNTGMICGALIAAIVVADRVRHPGTDVWPVLLHVLMLALGAALAIYADHKRS